MQEAQVLLNALTELIRSGETTVGYTADGMAVIALVLDNGNSLPTYVPIAELRVPLLGHVIDE